MKLDISNLTFQMPLLLEIDLGSKIRQFHSVDRHWKHVKNFMFYNTRNKQFHDQFFTYEHSKPHISFSRRSFLLMFVYFLCCIFSRNTWSFFVVFYQTHTFTHRNGFDIQQEEAIIKHVWKLDRQSDLHFLNFQTTFSDLFFYLFFK